MKNDLMFFSNDGWTSDLSKVETFTYLPGGDELFSYIEFVFFDGTKREERLHKIDEKKLRQLWEKK